MPIAATNSNTGHATLQKEKATYQTDNKMHIYSITQSYANSFWGDVVLDSFNNVPRDEDNILDQIYLKQMCSDFYYEDLKFWEGLKKIHI